MRHDDMSSKLPPHQILERSRMTFLAQYKHVMNTTPDRLSLQNLEKKLVRVLKILGMDWLSTHCALVDYFTMKVVF